jgi:hypothetical protein
MHVVVRASHAVVSLQKNKYAMLAMSQPVNTNPANPFPSKQTTAP